MSAQKLLSLALQWGLLFALLFASLSFAESAITFKLASVLGNCQNFCTISFFGNPVTMQDALQFSNTLLSAFYWIGIGVKVWASLVGVSMLASLALVIRHYRLRDKSIILPIDNV